MSSSFWDPALLARELEGGGWSGGLRKGKDLWGGEGEGISARLGGPARGSLWVPLAEQGPGGGGGQAGPFSAPRQEGSPEVQMLPLEQRVEIYREDLEGSGFFPPPGHEKIFFPPPDLCR